MFLNNRIKSARKQKDLSLEGLANLFAIRGHNISRQTLWNWESGGTVPDVENLAILAKVLEKPIEYFFTQKAKQNALVDGNGGEKTVR